LKWTRKWLQWPWKTTGRPTAESGNRNLHLAGFIFIVPKIGPLKLVAIKGPTQATEADLPAQRRAFRRRSSAKAGQLHSASHHTFDYRECHFQAD
jgi:hypothetical protein